jgi:hypothetical protein
MAFVVRRELQAHKQRTNRDNEDLVFGRTATEAFFASTIRACANKAWKAAGLDPITPHEARHCAISYFIAAGLDWKQISTWAGHGDVRQTWNRYGHLNPRRRRGCRRRLDAYLEPPDPKLEPVPEPPTTADDRYQADAPQTQLQTGRALRLWRTPPSKHEIPREHGGFGVPLPGFELCSEPCRPGIY